MAGTIVVDRIESDASYTSRINVASNVAFSAPVNFTGGLQVGGVNASFGGMRNRIINGDMQIDQRNAGASVSTSSGSSAYTLDRWIIEYSQNSKFTLQQNAGSVTPPVGYTNYLGITSSSAYSVGSGDYFALMQRIEGFNVSDLAWGTANAAPITVSFWVRSSLTGTFGGAIRNSGGTRSYPFTYTISAANTWEQKTITIPGDTSGTWLTNNGIGLRLDISLGMGSTYSGTAGTWTTGNLLSATSATSVVGTNGATFYITGVQLEKGSSATSFEYIQYQQEFALCQRYYERGLAGFVGTITNGHAGGTAIPFAVTKRTSPTMSQAASLNASGFASGVGAYFVTGVDGVAIYHTATTTGNCSWVDRYIADAEL